MAKSQDYIYPIVYAFIFVITFIIGVFMGHLLLPEFTGRDFISGLVFAIFATGAGTLVIQTIIHK